jgi:molecular chaperone GrpE (heat shock protein)
MYDEFDEIEMPIVRAEEEAEDTVQDKITKAKKLRSTLKQIEKLEKEIAVLKNKLQKKEQKLTNLAKDL